MQKDDLLCTYMGAIDSGAFCFVSFLPAHFLLHDGKFFKPVRPVLYLYWVHVGQVLRESCLRYDVILLYDGTDIYSFPFSFFSLRS